MTTPEDRIAELEAELAALRAVVDGVPEVLLRGVGVSASYPKAAKTNEEAVRAGKIVSAMGCYGGAVYTKNADGTHTFVRFATQEEDDAFVTLFHTVMHASDRYRDEAQENLDLANAATDIANGLIEAFKLCETSFERYAERKRSKMRGQSQQAALKGFATAGVWSAAAEELKTVVGRKMREAASAALESIGAEGGSPKLRAQLREALE